MKKLTLFCSILLSSASVFAQVQIDKKVQLTGTSTDAKVEGIRSVTLSQDAVSAEVIQKNNLVYAYDSGAVNAYRVILAPAVTAYQPGMIVNFKANSANTGAATVAVNNLANVTIKKQVTSDLIANDILAGQMVSVIYDGSNFQMLGSSGGGGGGVPSSNCILSTGSTAPTGYSFSGSSVSSGNTWTSRANMPTLRYALATAVVNNIIYAIGGYNGSFLGTNEAFDPATNTWTSKASMSTQRFLLDAAAVNNKIYVVGGWSQTGATEEYNPVSNSWTTKASMANPRSGLRVLAVNNKIYALGGSNGGNSQYYNYNEEYDPSTDTWTTKTSMPVSRDLFAAGVINGKIYITAGFNNNTGWLNATHIYDPATDAWTTGANIPTVRRGPYSAVANNKLYVMGGGDPNNKLTNEEYDPATNSWNNVTSMFSPRAQGGSAAVGNSIYLIGGTNDGGNNYFNTTLEFGAPVTYYIHCKN